MINGEHRSFFARDAAEQTTVLSRKLQAVQYDIRNDLGFIISTRDAEQMRNHHIRLLGTPLGFNLAMEVKSETLPNGEVRYQPAIPIPDDFEINLALTANNALLGNITNMRLNERDNLIYEFANDGEREAGTLSRPAPRYDSAAMYKMGDLVRLDGVLQQALEDNTGDRSKWQLIPGNGFVNEADRVLDKNSQAYRNWQLTFETPPRHPLGSLALKFKSTGTNQPLIDEEGYLATRRPSSTERPVAPRLELRLPGRRTYWRYLKKEGFTADEINRINLNASGFLDFTGSVFVTKQPRFYSRAFTVFENSLTVFPNPSPTSFSKEGKRFFSDIYFNKVNPIP